MTFILNIEKTLKILVMFSLLIGYGSVISIYKPFYSDLYTILTTLLLMIVDKSYHVNKKICRSVFIIYFITTLSMLCTHSSLTDYKGIYLRVFIVALIITAFRNNYDEIVKYFIKSLWMLVFLSLINYILILGALSLFQYKVLDNGYGVFTIGYVFNWIAQSEIMGITFVRNQSIFWEPGVLQIPINMLIYYILIERDEPLKNALLPILVLLTTGSTTGYIIFLFLLLYKFKNIFSLSGKKIFRTISVLFLIVIFLPILYFEIVQKFSGETKVSSAMRMYDLMVGMNVIVDNPIIGLGMNNDRYLTQLLSKYSYDPGELDFSAERGNTNTIISMMIKFGIPISLFLLIMLYRQGLFEKRFAFFVLMFFSLSSEPLLVVYLLILLMISSVNIRVNRKLNENTVFN